MWHSLAWSVVQESSGKSGRTFYTCDDSSGRRGMVDVDRKE